MLVQAKCKATAWDCPFLYRPGQGPLPGGLYEIDSESKLAKLEIRPGVYVFEFDREAAAKSSSVPATPTASPVEDLTPSPAGEVQPEPQKVDRRGKVPFTCKGCGESLPHLNALMQHKKICPGKVAQAPAQEAEATV